MSDSPEKQDDKLPKPSLKELERQIVKTNPEIFKGVSEKKKIEILKIFSATYVMASVEQKYHRGPLPSPDKLKEYAQVIPNGAERIMAMAEKEQEHRMKIENYAIPEQIKIAKRGQTYGLIIGLASVLIAGTCIMFGHEWPGAIFGATGIVGLVSVFVIGRTKSDE